MANFKDTINEALKSDDTAAIINKSDISPEDFKQGIEMFESLKGEKAMKVGHMLRENLAKRIAHAQARHV